MGPDELVTREEYELAMKALVALHNQQVAALRALTDILVAKIITPAEAVLMSERVRHLPVSQQAADARKALDDFLTMRNIARRYLDPQGENPKG